MLKVTEAHELKVNVPGRLFFLCVRLDICASRKLC